MPFTALGLSPELSLPLTRLGYTQPTPVQIEAIPVVLRGNDLLARAQTGTGKTAAFGLPMIHRLFVNVDRASSTGRRPRGLVLVPTRELAVQVSEALATYGAPMRARVIPIFGGAPMRRQVQDLQRGVDIIVATPGRLIDHIQQRTVDLSAVTVLVLDEADRMLDMGFLPPLRRVVATLPRKRQTLLCSATFSAGVKELSKEFTIDPVHVDVSTESAVASTVTHKIHRVARDNKRALLTHVLREPVSEQTLVFCRTKHGSNRVGRHLEAAGFRSAVIHGDKSQGARTRALADFKSGRVTVLVATDLAARGLDIEQLPLVVNFDLPLVAEDYVHRIGRTGRAGAPGKAVSLVSEDEASLLLGIQRLLPTSLEQVAVQGFEPAAWPQASAAPAARQPGRRPGIAGFSGTRSFGPGRGGRAQSRPGGNVGRRFRVAASR